MAYAFQHKPRRHARVFVLRRFDSAELVHRKQKVGESRFNDDRQMEARFFRSVNLALESRPSVSDRAEEIVKRLALDGKSRVAGDAVVPRADRAARDFDVIFVKVPRVLFPRIYRDLEHD